MALTLHQLNLFTLVYQKGSFNQAAHALYLSQAAVSQHIQKLEAGLGTPLFDRTPRGAVPTAAGETLYAYAQQILALTAEAEEAVMQLDAVDNQSLLIGATSGVSVYLIPPWLKQFQAEYPNINLSLKTFLPRPLIEALHNRQVELALFVGDTVDLGDSGLAKFQLQEIEYQVVMPADHPWSKQPEISHAQLQEAPFINRGNNSRARRWLDQEMESRGLSLQVAAELDSPGGIKYALLNHLGISILPDYAVEREVKRGELVIKRLEGDRLIRPLLMVWDETGGFNVVQQAFLRSLSTIFPHVSRLL